MLSTDSTVPICSRKFFTELAFRQLYVFYVELEPERSASADGKTTSFFATLSLSMVPGFTLGEQNNAEAFS